MKYLIILIFTIQVFASSTYEIRGKKEQFIFIDKKLVSKNCKQKKCKALKIKPIKNKFVANQGRNPSTQACKHLGGEIVFAISELDHETYFCRFSDNSLIKTGHLLK